MSTDGARDGDRMETTHVQLRMPGDTGETHRNIRMPGDTGETHRMSGDSARDNRGVQESVTSTWTRRVRVYWVPLTRYTRPLNILRKMRLSPHDHPALEEVVELDRGDQMVRGAEKLLDFLTSQEGLGPDDVTARWCLFDQALREVHPWLHQIVNGTCEASTQDAQRRVVNFFMDEICQTVNPEHLIRHFLSRDLLGQMECETLMRITQQQGPTLGAVYMVGHLPRSTNRNWYHDFLHVLMFNGYPELVKDLDESYYEKLMNSAQTEAATASPEMTTLQGGEEAEAGGSMDFAGAPPSLRTDGQVAQHAHTDHRAAQRVSSASRAEAKFKVASPHTTVHEESPQRHVTRGQRRDVRGKESDRPESLWPLSERRHIYVNVSDYRGETLVHIRHFAPGKDGGQALTATPRGIALKLWEWDALKSLIPTVDTEIRSRDPR